MKNHIALFRLFLLQLLLFLFCSGSTVGQESDGYRIHLEVSDLPEQLQISLTNGVTKEVVTKEFEGESSVELTFTGTVPELTNFDLRFSKVYYAGITELISSEKFYIGNDEVVLKGSIDSLEVTTNAETQLVLEKWKKESKQIKEQLREVKKKLFNAFAKGETKTKAYKEDIELRDDLSLKEEKAAVRFISRHNDSETAAYLLSIYYQRLPLDTLRKLYDELGETIKQSKYNEAIDIFLTTDVLTLGDSWYAFKAFNADGDTVSLSEPQGSAGKYILLAFVKRGCLPSEGAISELKEIYKKYHDKLEVVSYYQGISVSDLKAKVDFNEIEWTCLGSKKPDRRTLRSYNAEAFPQFVLISPERKLIYSWKKGYGEGLLTKKVEEYLGS